jgi:hypothetical protein
MKYPDKVRIGRATYCVHFMDSLTEGDLGGCDMTNKIILISKRQSKNDMLATFWHELLHAIEYEYRVKLGHPKIEKLEYDLAEVLLQFLK